VNNVCNSNFTIFYVSCTFNVYRCALDYCLLLYNHSCMLVKLGFKIMSVIVVHVCKSTFLWNSTLILHIFYFLSMWADFLLCAGVYRLCILCVHDDWLYIIHLRVPLHTLQHTLIPVPTLSGDGGSSLPVQEVTGLA